MARNDGIDRTVARNQDLGNPADVAKVQEHNEREKRDTYEPTFIRNIAIGVVLCILSVIPLIIVGVMEAPDYLRNFCRHVAYNNFCRSESAYSYRNDKRQL